MSWEGISQGLVTLQCIELISLTDYMILILGHPYAGLSGAVAHVSIMLDSVVVFPPISHVPVMLDSMVVFP